MSEVVLDAGALIALERGVPKARRVLAVARRQGRTVTLPASALAQAWRGGARQHELHLLLGASDVVVQPLDRGDALAVGTLLAATAASDISDAHVVICAQRTNSPVATSDPDDLRALDPTLELIVV